MAYPQFSKSGMTTLVFSRGDLFPNLYEEEFGQIVVESEARLLRVATLHPPVVYLSLHFERLPLADFTALKNWLHHASLRGTANTFTYTDSAGVATTVRWWPWGAGQGGSQSKGVFRMPQIAAAKYEVDIVLRKETVTW